MESAVSPQSQEADEKDGSSGVESKGDSRAGTRAENPSKDGAKLKKLSKEARATLEKKVRLMEIQMAKKR